MAPELFGEHLDQLAQLRDLLQQLRDPAILGQEFRLQRIDLCLKIQP